MFVGARASSRNLLEGLLARQTGTNTGCATYTVQQGDTCKSIAKGSNSTYAQIVSWNVDITSLCLNLDNLTNTDICISNPLGDYAIPTNTLGQTTIVTTVASIPTAVPSGTTSNCGEYYFIEEGDDCSTITEEFGITLQDFLFLNPEVWENCTNLWLDANYCVKPVGYISTYPGYGGTPTTKPFVQTNATSLPDIGDILANFTETQPIIPLANQTRVDCSSYIWFDNLTDNAAIDCWSLAQARGITSEEFILWNPSLGENSTSGTTTAVESSSATTNAYAYPCTLSASTSYCVNLVSSTTTSADTSIQTPIPRGAGEIANCTNWYAPQSYDTCEGILIVFDLTLDVLFTMNPTIGTDCTGMALGTYYCISTYPGGIPAGIDGQTGSVSSMTTTTTTAASTTTTGSPTTGVSTPTPVQTGITASCDEFYYVQSGDGCWAIANSYGIDLDDFYAWNPAVGSDCSGLWPNYYVCVEVSTSSANAKRAEFGDRPAARSTPMVNAQAPGGNAGRFLKWLGL